ncbi:MAG: hypothetical protein ABWX84_09275 [Nocardioides sp.]
MPLTSRPVLRRTTLAAAPLVALSAGLAGCRWGPDEDTTPQPTGSTGPASVDDDTEVAATALAATTRVADLVARVAARHRGLAGVLADVTLMHQAHADLLAEAGEASEEAAPRPVPGRSATALALVLTEERGLQQTLAESAGGAASGSFARALASMSAAVAQQRTRLGAVDVGATP